MFLYKTRLVSYFVVTKILFSPNSFSVFNFLQMLIFIENNVDPICCYFGKQKALIFGIT